MSLEEGEQAKWTEGAWELPGPPAGLYPSPDPQNTCRGRAFLKIGLTFSNPRRRGEPEPLLQPCRKRERLVHRWGGGEVLAEPGEGGQGR